MDNLGLNLLITNLPGIFPDIFHGFKDLMEYRIDGESVIIGINPGSTLEISRGRLKAYNADRTLDIKVKSKTFIKPVKPEDISEIKINPFPLISDSSTISHSQHQDRLIIQGQVQVDSIEAYFSIPKGIAALNKVLNTIVPAAARASGSTTIKLSTDGSSLADIFLTPRCSIFRDGCMIFLNDLRKIMEKLKTCETSSEVAEILQELRTALPQKGPAPSLTCG